MGNLVFQATLGGQVNLVGPNTASTFNLNVPATSSTIATLTGTETFTNKTLTSPTLTTPVLGTPSSGTLTNCTSLPVGGITATGTPSSTTYLRGDSTWATITATTPGGSTTQVQYNSSGSFAGSANMTFSGTALTLANDASISGLTVGKGGGSVSTATVVGNGAMAATNTGAYNAAFGNNASTSNTSGGYNTAIGAASLYTNSTGSYNTGIGMWALQANTTASDNTAVGYKAAYANTTGGGIIAVGGLALTANTTGASNVAMGYSALGSNTTGSYNVGFGQQALSANTTGGNNTAVGYQAGSANTTNSNNTYIGYTCGSSHVGAGCIFIGPNAFSGYNGSNQVVFKTGDGREALYADIGGGGSFRQYSNSATWAITSDQRVKENIVEITNGLEKIVSLRPVEFDYITSKEHNAGFVAQEFQNVLPDQVKLVKARPEEAELVGEDEIYTIQQNLTPYLVKAIQQLKTIVDAQAATITSQADAITALTARVVALEAK